MDIAGITPLIITANEEPNIARVLQRLDWAARIVVVDDFSTDGTVALLSADRRVKVLQRRFDSFAAQCNFGLSHVETPWVLSLDADYVCDPELVRELAALPSDPAQAGFSARFRYCIAGRRLRATLYPPRTVLYRRQAAIYEDVGHAHRVKVNGPVGWLRSTIDHDDRKPIGAWLAAQSRYAAREVEKLTADPGATLDLADRLRRRKVLMPFLMPLYCLLYKGLVLDGMAGWHYTLQRTYAEVLVTLMLFEHDWRPRS